MDRIETRELGYLVTLAEELSFTRAAERLGIAQPPLSRAVARLERRLGVSLFRRTSRSVALTEAGAEFVARARAILADVDALPDGTRKADRTRPMVVAVRPGTGSGLLADLLAGWAGPAVRPLLARAPADAVRVGTAHLALCCRTDGLAGLRVTDVQEQPTFALLGPGHPLGGRDSLTLDQVTAAPGFLADCPDRALEELFDLVLLAGAVVLVSGDVAARGGHRLRCLPVADAPPTRLCLARQPGPVGHPALPAFLRHAALAGSPT